MNGSEVNSHSGIVNHTRVLPWNVGNTVGMLKVEAERTMENVRCQAEVENKPDKLTNY